LHMSATTCLYPGWICASGEQPLHLHIVHFLPVLWQ
jgi:hypothetical protein